MDTSLKELLVYSIMSKKIPVSSKLLHQTLVCQAHSLIYIIYLEIYPFTTGAPTDGVSAGASNNLLTTHVLYSSKMLTFKTTTHIVFHNITQ